MNYDKQNRKMAALQARAEKAEQEAEKYKLEASNTRSALESTMHEVRRLTSSLSGYANTLVKQAEQSTLPRHLHDAIETIFHTSGMITARLSYTDIQLNPQAIGREARVPAGLFKKFEKARYVLAQKAASKRIRIRLVGESRGHFRAITVFELIPFLILDNAIKYSPDDQEIEVTFVETNATLRACVSSLGPPLANGEEELIFEKGYRGQFASQSFSGDGLGLYVSRQIAAFHERMNIRATSDPNTKLEKNGTKYSEFKITIEISL